MTDQQSFDVAIIGGGPIGLACGIEAQKRGLSAAIFEKGCLTHSLFQYPVNMRFFSTSNLLEIGGVPFPSIHEKPTRAEALEYYRRVAQSFQLNVHLYENVVAVDGEDGGFTLETNKRSYKAKKVALAIGFFDIPRLLNAPGEGLGKVTHYYREPYPYSGQNLLIVGSGNSAAIAALECYRHGARVACAVRGPSFHDSIKYWIRPDLDNRIQDGEITAYCQTSVKEIKKNSVVLQTQREGFEQGKAFEIDNDFVLALTGYEPDFSFLKKLGIEIGDDAHSTPVYNCETQETNRAGVYLAGVVVGGMKTNQWFIENSRVHAAQIMEHIGANS